MKIVVSIVLIILFVGIIYGLWQLQPKAPLVKTGLSNSGQSTPSAQLDQSLQPKDGSVIKDKTVKLKGQMFPDSIILITADGFVASTRADQSGIFEKEITLSPGLNLINIISVASDMSRDTQKSISLYQSTDSSAGTMVIPGSVKTIFDNLITLTTLNGEKNVKVSSLATITFPNDPQGQQSTQSAKDIRIGDYLVALGDSQDTDTLSAKKITVIRQDKPQISKQYSIVKILSSPKFNIFTAKTTKDSKVIELTLNKSSQVQLGGQDSKTSNITKDKNAIVVFENDDTASKIADLIYLLP